MEDTSTDSLKCTHYSTILKVRTYGNCFPCECFCYKNKVHEIEQVFFIIYVICQWYSKLTKFIKINNTWLIQVRGCVILSSSSPVFYFHCFFSHWLVMTSTKMSTAKRKVKYSDHSNRCWVNTVWAAGEMLLMCSWIDQMLWCCKDTEPICSGHSSEDPRQGREDLAGWEDTISERKTRISLFL